MWKIDRNRFVGLRITKSALATIAIALMSYTEIRQVNRLYTWSLRGFPSAKDTKRRVVEDSRTSPDPRVKFGGPKLTSSAKRGVAVTCTYVNL